MGWFPGSLALIQGGHTKRQSSWDRRGKNEDHVEIGPGETRVLADIEGPGQINHIYLAMILPDLFDYREAALRMFWDGEDKPSVEVPFGDFFCVSNCLVRRFTSQLVTVNLGMGKSIHSNNGFNCYFPMPFATAARIEIENQSNRFLGGAPGSLWYHIDYETHDSPPAENAGRFHAQWRRENLTRSPTPEQRNVQLWDGANLDGKENYVILEAEGEGHLVGILLNVDNVAGGWWGEGDDMIFINGEKWPPSLHGTGTEEIFGGGAGPDSEYAGPYTGFHLVENLGGETYAGKSGMYRWYIHDPIRFSRSIRVSIEHGHANSYENDYSSVAYWYQTEPHKPFDPLPPAPERIPIFPEELLAVHRKCGVITNAISKYKRQQGGFTKLDPKILQAVFEKFNAKDEAFETHNYAKMDQICDELLEMFREMAPEALEE